MCHKIIENFYIDYISVLLRLNGTAWLCSHVRKFVLKEFQEPQQ